LSFMTEVKLFLAEDIDLKRKVRLPLQANK
jgi:hypothetical protein